MQRSTAVLVAVAVLVGTALGLGTDIKAEKAKGAIDAQLASARDYQRKGQFMIDFVMSENSMGFHAPQEATRILGDAINLFRLGQLSLHGGPAPSHNPPNIENITSAPQSTADPRELAKKQVSTLLPRPALVSSAR